MPVIHVFQPSRRSNGVNGSCGQVSPIKPTGPARSPNHGYVPPEQAEGRKTWSPPLTALRLQLPASGAITPTANKVLDVLPDPAALAWGKATALGLGVTLSLWIGMHVGATRAAEIGSAYRPLPLQPVEWSAEPGRPRPSDPKDLTEIVDFLKGTGPIVSVCAIVGAVFFQLGIKLQKLNSIDEKIDAARKDTEKQFAAVDKQFIAAREDTEKQFAAAREDTAKQFAAAKEATENKIDGVKESVDKLSMFIQRLDDKISRTDRSLAFLEGDKWAKSESSKSL